MKKYILATLALILTAGTFDASAQSLLKKLGHQCQDGKTQTMPTILLLLTLKPLSLRQCVTNMAGASVL